MNAIVQHDSERLPSLQSGGAVKAIVPQDFDGAWRIALAVCKAGMAPKGLETPEKAMVAIMHGMEVGMTPMASLQSIAVVNGRPTIWGDGAIGLVRGSGKLEWIKEKLTGDGENMAASCEVKRKGEADPTKATFSVADAKKANLWGKQGPWQQYPKRMLAMRARAFALRDAFADVLRGLGIAEEVQDTPQERPQAPKPPAPPAPPTQKIGRQEAIDAETGEVVDDRQIVRETGEDIAAVMADGEFDAAAFFDELETNLAGAMDEATVEEVWSEMDAEAQFDGDDINLQIAVKIKERRLSQIGGNNG
ncbi:recombinase RecT [Nitratireductor aquimarinus]|uniref:recombinase RecT n=1 Tax=Nitratireductor TaxID=245876 RepID=UPI0019D34E32|nr:MULTISPECIES: recombinase RecT [Nitratireductor]MBN7777731.1 recombinase RecT [Nitratireductor pacificus]MBN7781725.1 recombinase RecT [Nitratireductor pacificus]MBN7790531.1 recombinase RecT [Nitratireductor aquimarinus]MBY6099941.1 recombinase RecT [Nitratireductor aquimarinus]MCA1260407.1 recombinase RecT [Nitratireductor aquimarinus]